MHSKQHTLTTIRYLSSQELVVSDYQSDQRLSRTKQNNENTAKIDICHSKTIFVNHKWKIGFMCWRASHNFINVSSSPFTPASQHEQAKSIAQWLFQKYVEIEKEHMYEYRSIISVGTIINTDIVCTFEIELYCQPDRYQAGCNNNNMVSNACQFKTATVCLACGKQLAEKQPSRLKASQLQS